MRDHLFCGVFFGLNMVHAKPFKNHDYSLIKKRGLEFTPFVIMAGNDSVNFL